jgi:phosphatase NudJ
MARAYPFHGFVLVVVEHEGKFVVIREAKENRGFYLPAGGMEVGESIQDTAVRETEEEAGIRIEPIGLLHVDQTWSVHSPSDIRCRLRYFVRARPVGSLRLKTTPDHHSEGAWWLRPDEMTQLTWRHDEANAWIAAVAAGRAAMIPLDH